jgi:signal transduction histidine kinase/putative methionine-R-sulfoxide reductase with GAF domain
VIVDIRQPETNDIDFLLSVSNLFQYLEVDEVLKQLLPLARAAVNAEEVSIIIFRGNEVEWHHYMNKDEHLGDIPYLDAVLSDGLAGWVRQNQQLVVIHDTEHDSRWLKKAYIRSVLCAPVIHHGELLAILTLNHSEPNHFTTHHVQLIQIVSNQSAIAIHNARVFEQLQTTQNQMETVLRAFPNLMMVMDHVGRLLIVNDAMLALLDKTNYDEVIGQRLTDMPNRDECLDDVCQILLEVISTPLKPIENVFFEVSSTILERDFQVTISTWSSTQRHVAGYVIVLSDITQIRELANFKDEMLRIAAHDLRNPLSLIVGYTDMIMLETPKESASIHSYIEAITQSSNRMDQLLEEILRVERIRHSPLELHQYISPQSVMAEAAENLQAFADKKGIQLTIYQHPVTTQPIIKADPLLIRQAMENLINNALKYTPSGGEVHVTNRIDVMNQRFHFAVVDNGIGIPPDKVKYVFESFYRINDPAISNEQGFGLGLSLVKNVIEKHSGGVWVDSVLRSGSRFGFWLPLHQLEAN